ncbi:MAG: MFS transporter [Proteobacteria bacterium]|nr:MFS transporter [Pseudomonadota bacterium]
MDKEVPTEGSLEEREAAYDRFVRDNLKRNYAGHYLHGMLGMTGFRLVNAPTFVPAYLNLLSHSDAIVGLGLALQQLGGIISPIVGAAHIEHRKRVLPVSMTMGTLMRVQILGLALSGWLLSGTPLLIAVMFFLFMLGLFTGPQRVAFQFLLAKVIPIEWRGRLQGWRNMTGGLIAAVLSYFAGVYFIGPNLLGNGYAVTFLVAFVLTSLGLAAIRILMREPEPPTIRDRTPLRERLRDVPALLKSDRGFFWFMFARTFAIAGRVAAPFYILYVSAVMPLTGHNIGLLSFAYLMADTVTNLAWGTMADKSGFRSTMVVALVIWIASTVFLMEVHQVWLIFIAFFGLGAAQSGYMMSSQNIVFEFGHRDDVAMRLAISNTAESVMSALGPLAGGLIATSFGYEPVFWLSVAFEIVALAIMIGWVKEPRKARQRA